MKLSEIKDSMYIKQEGEYTFKITDVQLEKSQAGKDKYVITCETKDEQISTLNISLEAKALFKLKQLLLACGFDKDYDLDFVTLPMKLNGRKFIGVVTKSAPKPNLDGTMSDKVYYNITSFRNAGE